MIYQMQRAAAAGAAIVLTLAVATGSIQHSDVTTDSRGGARMATLSVSEGSGGVMALPAVPYVQTAASPDAQIASAVASVVRGMNAESRNVFAIVGAAVGIPAVVALRSPGIAFPLLMVTVSVGALLMGHLHTKKLGQAAP